MLGADAELSIDEGDRGRDEDRNRLPRQTKSSSSARHKKSERQVGQCGKQEVEGASFSSLLPIHTPPPLSFTFFGGEGEGEKEVGANEAVKK